MKIKLCTLVAGVGLALVAACNSGHNNNQAGSTTTGASGSSAPPSSAPTDFVDFVYQQIGTEPAFGGSAPASTAALTSDLELNNGFSQAPFSSGNALPATTYSAAVACTQAGTTACNPAVSDDLNSSLN